MFINLYVPVNHPIYHYVVLTIFIFLFLYLLEEGPKNYYVTYIIYSIIYFLYIYCKTYYNYLYVWIYFRHVILVYSLHFFSAALFFLKISLLFILFTFGCVCT